MKQTLIKQLKQQKLSVGILSGNWLDFPKSLKILADHKINILHFDVADGQFCPMFTVGVMAIKSFPTDYFKDVHLLVKDQFTVAKSAVANGANLVTLQIEQPKELEKALEWLGSQSNVYQGNDVPVLRGLSLCPETPLAQLEDYLTYTDVIQLLTLDPRTGQKAQKRHLLEKITELQSMLADNRFNKLINIDGSMTLALASEFRIQSDVDWIVSGSALFSEELSLSLAKWKQAHIFE